MMHAVPLTVLPLIAYNLIGYSLSGADPWATEFLAVPMPSGARWSPRLGDVLVVFAIAMLYVEVVRAAAPSPGAALNRILSTVVLIVYVAEFLAADVAAHSVFFILMAIAIADVVAGCAIRRARREVAPDRDADEPP
jgi:uncharacterized membrane protein (DUF485 family)